MTKMKDIKPGSVRTMWNPMTNTIGSYEVVQATYVKKSACPCGYTIINEFVPLGKKYLILPATKAPGHLTCCGCGKTTDLDLVMAIEGDGPLYLPLPWDMFAIAPEKTA